MILSGWARRRAPAAEAELHAGRVAGPDAPGGARRYGALDRRERSAVARIARELGASEVVVVTSRWHAPRAAALVRAALHGTGIAVTVSSPRGVHEPLLAVRELVVHDGAPAPADTRA